MSNRQCTNIFDFKKILFKKHKSTFNIRFQAKQESNNPYFQMLILCSSLKIATDGDLLFPFHFLLSIHFCKTLAQLNSFPSIDTLNFISTNPFRLILYKKVEQ